jgi:endonuclease/exonuclease/phosphatase family metal-dependent hydrolase
LSAAVPSRGARRRAPILAALVAILALAALPAAASADQAPRLKVQTHNLYLGADLNPAIAAPDLPSFITAANGIWANVKSSRPQSRLAKIADIIASEQPDVVGLQEVSKWTAQNLSASSKEPSFDFLNLLLRSLRNRGALYRVASTSNNAHIGPIPLPSPGAPKFLLTLDDRDVILVRNREGLGFRNPQHGNYTTQAVVPSPVGPLSFNRGWASIDGAVDGKKFHFVDTHLEVEGLTGPIQEAQGNELLAGPASGPKPVIVVGDLNSAADGSTTKTYANVTKVFTDAWVASRASGPGFTCCQAANLLNPVSSLFERIDFVLTNGAADRSANAHTVGDRHGNRTPFGRWPSDHAGVVARVFP